MKRSSKGLYIFEWLSCLLFTGLLFTCISLFLVILADHATRPALHPAPEYFSPLTVPVDSLPALNRAAYVPTPTNHITLGVQR